LTQAPGVRKDIGRLLLRVRRPGRCAVGIVRRWLSPGA